MMAKRTARENIKRAKNGKTKRNAAAFFSNMAFVIGIIARCRPAVSVILLIGNLASGAFASVNIYIWKRFVDETVSAITNGGLRAPLFYLALLCVTQIAAGTIGAVCAYLGRLLSDELDKYISNIIIDKISHLSMPHFDDAAIYDLIEKANGESAGRIMSISFSLITAIRSAAAFAGACFLLLPFDPAAVILLIAFAALPFWVNIKIALKQHEIYQSRVSKLRRVFALKALCADCAGIKELMIYRVFGFIKQSMNDVYDTYINENKKTRVKNTLSQNAADITQKILSYAIRVYMFIKLIAAKKTIGDLTMCFSAANNLEGAVFALLDCAASLFDDNLYIESLKKLTLIKNENSGRALRKFGGDFNKITFENVSFRYPGAACESLCDINLTIEKNKTYAITGENGSGKTTLIKLLCGLYEPTSGRILIDGTNINDFSKETIYARASVIFQDYIKYPLTAGENIGVGDIENVKNKGIIKNAAKKSGADAFIEKLPKDYDTLMGRQWHEGAEVSSGQWQKIALARALANKNACVLVFDEPTSVLDAKSEQEFFNALRPHARDKICVFITHRAENVKNADVALVMRNGRIVDMPPHAAALRAQNKAHVL